jgi:hypothetical protein
MINISGVPNWVAQTSTALSDEQEMFGAWFRDPETWRSWRAFPGRIVARTMDKEQAALFREFTGR